MVIFRYLSTRLYINISLNSWYSRSIIAVRTLFELPMKKMVLVLLKPIRFDAHEILRILRWILWSGAEWIIYNISTFELWLQDGGDKIVTSVKFKPLWRSGLYSCIFDEWHNTSKINMRMICIFILSGNVP